MSDVLTKRWNKLTFHKPQNDLWNAETRFRVVPAGRRSGKTELAKRYVVEKALMFTDFHDGWFVCSAPTHSQAKRIFWKDICSLVPKQFIQSISISELTVRLINGAEISVLGLDQPQRIEGRPIDGIICDEYGNMKPEVWTSNLRPALSTRGRPGWAWLIGVPEGRNHYYTLALEAQKKENVDWSYHHWLSADILAEEEIEAAKRDLDELTFKQEYEASFVNFSGRAYYPFDRDKHCMKTEYVPNRPLIFCFDFNVAPGIAVICQEQVINKETVTVVIDEVYIPRNSNTPAVCRRLIKDWSHHKGDVHLYGDATGGARGTAKVAGSDWEIIRDELKPTFRERLKWRVPRSNPRERVRVNAMNTRLENASKEIKLFIDESNCSMLARDLEGVILLEGGSGEIDKKHDPNLTHLSDALGYYLVKAHPTAKQITTTTTV
tara:strand:+ start:2450 stop:3757 length:1308 start_codon:yes stop_codon:yes gene_type:complete